MVSYFNRPFNERDGKNSHVEQKEMEYKIEKSKAVTFES